jgi:hypothetical protein
MGNGPAGGRRILGLSRKRVTGRVEGKVPRDGVLLTAGCRGRRRPG